MTELNGTTFQEAINSSIPTAVDFWAEWCMPCKIFAPVLQELADELDGKADFCKLNIDDYGEVAQQYGIESIPTVVVFRNGREVARTVGVQPKDKFKALIEGLR